VKTSPKVEKDKKKNFRNEYLKDIIMVEFQYLVVIVKKIASIQNSMKLSLNS
jgi:hypothetical protein